MREKCVCVSVCVLVRVWVFGDLVDFFSSACATPVSQ